MADHKNGAEKIAQKQPSTKESNSIPSNGSDMNGLTKEAIGNKQYRIIHESGVVLPFVLQGKKEAIEMERMLARIMILQETCRDTKKLKEVCKTYSRLSMLDDKSTDIYLNDNGLVPGVQLSMLDTEVFQSEKIESIIRGDKFQNVLKDGTYSFAEGISTFLNAVQEVKVQVAKQEGLNKSRVAQK